MARLNLPVDILLWEQMIGEMPLKVITLNLLICVHAYKLGRCDFFCFYAKTFGKVKKSGLFKVAETLHPRTP